MKLAITFVFNFFALYTFAQANSITWNSMSADPVSIACGDGETLSISFSVTNADVLDLDVDLGIGIEYIANSVNIVSGATLISENNSDPNHPIFQINVNAGASVVMTLNRKATCDSRVGQLNGNTFEDEAKITKSGVQIGISQKSNAYQINYAALSITNQTTTPTTSNVGGTVTRSVTITNGSFGYLSDFTFKDVRPVGTITVQNINVIEGANTYPINPANINTTSTELSISIDGTIISQIGNNNSQFEFNEVIVLEYTMSVLDCYQGAGTPSNLSVYWGCDGTICQTASTPAAINISNSVPELTLTTISQPNMDFCGAVTYSTKLQNNSTDPKDFARDVAVILGLRSNTSAIARPTNNTIWSGDHQNVKTFSNFKLNGISITLPKLNYYGPVDYIAYDHFTTDPDGVGGLDDIDGDGYYDDLAPGAFVDISFDVTLSPKDVSCSNESYGNYIHWEHISADASWHNQCGTPMQPVRDEFIYTNFIRNYLNSTPVAATPNIFDGQPFTVSIKPHIYAGINCNGESAINGSGVNFRVALVLPPGVSLSPTATTDSLLANYNPNIYQSNDTVYYSINRVIYEWFNFELVMDCNLWPGTSSYAAFDFITHYSCSDGTNICFEKDIHCETVVTLPHCGGGCKGVATTTFETKRINPGWTDNNQNAFSTTFETGFAQPYDTVRFKSIGEMHDTAVTNLSYKATYASHSANNIFNYHTGFVTIYDANSSFGQTAYTFPITSPPIVTALAGNIFEVDLDLTSFLAQIDPAFHFENQDSILVNLDFVVSNDVPNTALNTLTDFLCYFSFDNNGTEHICNRYGSSFSYGTGTLSTGNSTSNHSNCGGSAYHHWTNRTQVTGVYTNEYRPVFYLDSLTLDLPTGMNFVKIDQLGGGSASPYVYDPPTIQWGNHITLPRPIDYRDPNNVGTFYPNMVLNYAADCRLVEGTHTIANPMYAKEYAYLLDPSTHVPVVKPGNIVIRYTPPNFTINAGEQKKITLTDEVEWEMEVCNTTSSGTISHNWLLVDDLGGQVNITGASEISSGTAIPLTLINDGSGLIMIQVDDLTSNVCKTIRIAATYTGCIADTIGVTHGWSCFDYPNASELFACGTQYEFEVVPQTAQLSMAVTPLATTPSDPANANSAAFGQSTVDMCTPFPVEVVMTSAQIGYLYEVIATMNNPISGGASGLEFVTGSGYIEYPAGTTPRGFSAAANTALLAASADPTMPFSLSQIDPTNFNNLPFKGVGSPDSNKVVLRFMMRPACDLNSGDVLSFESSTIANCGDPALGSGELISAYNLRVTGAITPYSANISTLSMPDIYNCSQNNILNVALTKIGTVAVGANDKLVIVLPPDVTYNSLISCTSSTCVDISQLTITSLGNKQILNFKMPAMNNGDDLAFSLSVSYNTTTHGCSENTELLTAQVVYSTTIFCPLTGSNCPNSGAVVGQKATTINFYKPEIVISSAQIDDVSLGATPQVYDYEFTVQNAASISSITPITIDIYCADNLGNPIGSAIHTIATSGNLAAGQTVQFQGNFSNSCNASHGVVIQATQQMASGSYQCLCSNEVVKVNRRPLGSISGEIFFDVNLNGTNDLENAGALVQNTVVRLLDAQGNAIINPSGDTMKYTLGINGLFNFSDLAQGIYRVVLDQTTTPSGYEGGTPNERLVAVGLGQDVTDQDLAIQNCQLSISNATSTTPDCVNPLGGEIIINAISNNTIYYSITNEPNYQTNHKFSNLGMGVYQLRIKNIAGCTATYPTPIPFDIGNCSENCINGIDDDGDGLIDCDDPDCQGVGTSTQVNHN